MSTSWLDCHCAGTMAIARPASSSCEGQLFHPYFVALLAAPAAILRKIHQTLEARNDQ